MSTVNVLFDKANKPDDEQLETVLAQAWASFEELRRETSACEQEWKHYGNKYGWKLKIHSAGKTLLELTVAEGWFLVSMAIRAKEREALIAEAASSKIADLAASASLFAEGHAIKIEVRDRASCERAMVLARFIMSKRSAGPVA